LSTEEDARQRRLQQSLENSGVFLLSELHGPLLAVARARGLPREMAEDVVQDAFLALVARRPRPRNVEAWLVRIVSRRAVDYHRSRAVERRLNAHLEKEMSPQVVERDPLVRFRVRRAIRTLPARVRQLLWNYFVAGRTGRDSALRVGYSEKSFKKTLQRAIATIRAELEVKKR